MQNDPSDKQPWVPENAGDEFTTRTMKGVEGGHDGLPIQRPSSPQPTRRRPKLTTDDYVQGVLAGDRPMLARAITLIESNAERHIDQAQAVLKQLLPHTGGAIRVGITGVPGAGKSTFIETLGTRLTAVSGGSHKVAVLAIDPTSSISGGSILGDKTRMQTLASDPNAFIRPSPTGGVLGGVARKTRETILVCEAAGFDVVLVETVGTGQSEITVRSMVDFFLLLLVPGAGDELQGIKKGVVELADAILINKADGPNKVRADAARAEYNRALHYLTPAVEGWRPRAYTGSALTGDGIDKIWDVIMRYREKTETSGAWDARRRNQLRDWLYTLIEEQLRAKFFNLPEVKASLPGLEQAVMDGDLPATAVARNLLNLLDRP